MNFVQEVRDLLNLVNNDECFGWIPEKALPEFLRMLLKAISYIGLQEVDVNRFWEALFQKGGFPCLTAAKEEHCLIQPVLYVEYSMVHNSSKFPQPDCGFSRNIRNDTANLTKII